MRNHGRLAKADMMVLDDMPNEKKLSPKASMAA